jgi:enoyl-CoA hydratase/carnithine racemase
MASFQDLIYEVRDFVCTITMNRPAKRNALSSRLVNELIYALEIASGDDAVRVIILTGAGGAFCAGGDLSQMSGGGSTDSDIPQRGGFVELNMAFTTVNKPVIAKVRRYALAGGLGLMCGCQFAFSEESATFGTPEIHRGLWPMMIMANIFRVVPRRKGLELIMSGDRITADTASQIGLINGAVPSDELDDYVWDFAQKLVDRPPQIMALGLEAFYQQSDLDYEAALPYLNGMLMKCLSTQDAQKGLMAFMTKSKPNWRE